MRFIYIVGILLLIAIGFLVYFYRDWLWGTIDGFQAGGSGGVVFQLFEQRCYNTSENIGSTDNLRYFPTVNKSTALLICNRLKGRLATYSELKTAVIGGLVIDSDKPVMVIDSDITYTSNNRLLIPKNIDGRGYDKFNTRMANGLCVRPSPDYIAGEQAARSFWAERKSIWDSILNAGGVDLDYITAAVGAMRQDLSRKYTNAMRCSERYYDLDGYLITKDTNWDTVPFTNYYLDWPGLTVETTFNRKQNPTETYGHPVCFAPAPPGNTVDVVFPTKAGMGWNNDNDTYTETNFVVSNMTFTRTNISIGGSSFTKRYNIRKNGDTTPFNGTCPMPAREAAGSTINLVQSTAPPSVSFNTPAPTTPQRSYNILNMDAIYTQVDIAAIDLPIRRDAVIANEQVNISSGIISTKTANTDLYPGANEGGRRVRNAYASLVREAKANKTTVINLINYFQETLSTVLPNYQAHGAIISALQSGNITTTQFSNMLLKNIDDYYNALLIAISSHPVAFLRKGIINFPSFLNSFKIYNLPDPNTIRTYMHGSFQTYRQKEWEIKSDEANHFGMVCQDGTSDYYYNKGSIADWDFRTESQTNYDHNPPTWWCRKTQGVEYASCRDGTAYSWWAATCLKEYYQARTAITDDHYMISSQKIQETYDIYSSNKYKTVIDANWTPVGDPGNPIITRLLTNPVSIQRNIPVIGSVSVINIGEIEDSISLSICLNFTDTGNIESQIRISADDYDLYMSPDASAKPEFKTTIDASHNITLNPANTDYNNIHCAIKITETYFFLLAASAQKIISAWATARYQRLERNIPSFLTVPKSQSFSSTTISIETKHIFLNNIANFYYNNEKTLIGTLDRSGYATINKFVDVFQIGDTIFDVRFEEYRKRGPYFQEQLRTLDTEYNQYKLMNLSKEDQLELESRYLRQKAQLYSADDNFIWGRPQKCGVAAQYVVIESKNGLFDISQILIINSSGQNVALNATFQTSLTNLDYGSAKRYYNPNNGNEDTGEALLTSRRNDENNMRITKEALLLDGNIIPRYSPNTYKTKLPITNLPIILDLGQIHQISVVEVILPANVSGATHDMYSVYLRRIIPATVGSSAFTLGSAGSTSTSMLTGGKLIFRYAGTDNINQASCPSSIHTRFHVARFYTTVATPLSGSTTPPWTVTGYSKGIDAALTFNSKYNGGVFVDTSKNDGNFVYLPNVTYSLNLGGSANIPPLDCSDPLQIKRTFNHYNILVNSDIFRYETRLSTPFNNFPDETYTATKVTHVGQNNDNCIYRWEDKVVKNNIVSSILREGMFPYPFDTNNFDAYERVLDLNRITIPPAPITTGTNSLTALSPQIDIPEMYMKSVTLDSAGGFCPALQCSDTEVMNSLIGIYNTNIPYYSQNGSMGGSFPQISKIHKAITPNSSQCEFLVDTIEGTQRKVQFNNINVKGPHTLQQTGPDGKSVSNENCVWVAATGGTSGIAGVIWDNAPKIINSTPYLLRVYNYALDIMRPFSNAVTSTINDLMTMGSAQLNPAGSGIVNALVQYRTDTVAAAGDIRYFQNINDEFGNKCEKVKCKSASVINSLYKYYAQNMGSDSHSNKYKLKELIRTGMTDDENYCDFTFTVDNYQFQLGGSFPPVTPVNSVTSGLRCKTRRTPFSCNFSIETCSYINPTPTLSDIKAIPNKFIQTLSLGSNPTSEGSTLSLGSNPTSGGSTTDITTAALDASGSQSLLQPPNGRKLLRSIDYIDCSSRYGGGGINRTLTLCENKTFAKLPGSLMLVPSGWAAGTLPPGITLIEVPPPPSTVGGLVPYTIVSFAGASQNNLFEYRITTENTLDFNETFIRAGFYKESDDSIQLAYLVPADTASSPNAFLRTNPNFAALAVQFKEYWNNVFANNKTGNKIGTIAGYYTNMAEDSITFVADSATFGPLGKYDIEKYYSTALYKVFFRIPYQDTSGTTRPFIYKVFPLPKDSHDLQGSSGNLGTMTTLSTGGASSDPTADYVIRQPIQIMRLGFFRSFKFTVTKVAQDTPIEGGSSRTRAEISRIYFYKASLSSGTSSYTFSNVFSLNPNVTLEETQAPTTYTRTSNRACGIGYYSDGNMGCIPTNFYREVLNPAMITTNKYVPRLRLDVNKSMTIDFMQINAVNAFSFIIGSSFNRPLQWRLQGSINNIDWIDLHIQNTDFPYATTAGSGRLLSFITPGYFMFSFNYFNGERLNSSHTSTQLAQYTRMTEETTEGFKDSEPNKPRMRNLRWKILETQKPNAPYVHVSMLRFFTGAGPVPISVIKISNPHGSRRSAANGPSAALSDEEGKRWIDYNKSELLITFDLAKLPSNLINGFQFTVPSGLADAKDYFPARWLLEGSYDGRIWVTIHKKSDRAKIIGNASPIYKFNQSI